MSQNVPFTIQMAPEGARLCREPGASAAACEHLRAMFGGGSIQLGRVFGIRVGVDISWFFALFLIIFTLSSYYEDVAPGSSPFVLATVSAHALLPLDPAARVRPRDRRDPQRHPDPGNRPLAVRRRGEARARLGLTGRRVPRRGGGANRDARDRRRVHGPRRADLEPGGGARQLALRGLHLRCDARRARLPGVDQHHRAGLQPDPRLPARRRAHRPRDRMEDHRATATGRRASPARSAASWAGRWSASASSWPWRGTTSSAESGSRSSASSSLRLPAQRSRKRTSRTGSAASGSRT